MTGANDDYYRHTRREITPLLPPRPGRVLEVGCGGGDTLRWLKARQPEITTTGVEYNPAMKGALESNADFGFIGSITDILPRLGEFDTILCLDVLEHLHDSDQVLAGLVKRLSAGGSVIISLPNVAHVSVSLPLLFRRRFRYADAGILDRTHVRFFVEETIVEFVNRAGLTIDDGRLSGLQGGKWRLADRVSLGCFRHYLAKQYVFRAVRTTGAQPPIDWRPLAALPPV